MKILKLFTILVISFSIFGLALGMEDQNDTHQDKKQRRFNKLADNVNRCYPLEEADVSQVKSLKFICAQNLLQTDWRSIQLQEDLIEYLAAMDSINKYIQNLINNLSKTHEKIVNSKNFGCHEMIKKCDCHNSQKAIEDHKLLLYKLVVSGKVDLRYISELLEDFMTLMTAHGFGFVNNYLKEINVSEINLLLIMVILNKTLDKADLTAREKLKNIASSAVIHIRKYLCCFLKRWNLFPSLNEPSKHDFGFLGELLRKDITAEALELLISIVGNKNPLWKSTLEDAYGKGNILHYCEFDNMWGEVGDRFNLKDIPRILAILINIARENDVDLDKLLNQDFDNFGDDRTPSMFFIGRDYGKDSLEIYFQIIEVFAACGAKIDWDARSNKTRIVSSITKKLEQVIYSIDISTLEDCEEVEKYVSLTVNLLAKIFPKIEYFIDMNFPALVSIDNKLLEFNLAYPEHLKTILGLIQEKRLQLIDQLVDIKL